MAETVVKVSGIKLVNPFCRCRNSIVVPLLDNHDVARVVSMEVDKETLTTKPVFNVFNVDEEIQSCKDLCGMEYMKKLLASGQVTAEDLQDNAGADLDLTRMPESPQEALRKANEVNEQIGKLAQAIGCEEGKKYTAQEIETMLTAAIKQQYEAQQAAAAAAAGGDAK